MVGGSAGVVVAGVALEALIVYHGWRAYRVMRGLLRGVGRTS